MYRTDPTSELKEAIVRLENKQAIEKQLLRKQFIAAYESLKLVNIIKNTFRELSGSEDVKDNFFRTFIAIFAESIIRKIHLGASANPLKKFIGVVLQSGITNFITNNSEHIKSFGIFLLRILLKKASGSRHKKQEAEAATESAQNI
ncbi:MAG: hypothetical protein Q8859_08205 [Bacteroidota bacterium]|nr:hypothetical protein [Bacteroidota bacterium]